MKLPKKFEDKMKELLGDEYIDYQNSLETKHFTGLRINTLKISPEEFEKISPFEIKKIPFIQNGYYYNIEEQPARHPYYYAGLYYIQEPSAMIPASLLPIEPGDKVLDLCAAPGGKSTDLAAKLNGTGLLVSNDISNSRAKALLKNIELFGIKNAIVMSEDPDKLTTYFNGYFDKILIDAPCSGEGMFRKDPSMVKNWEEFGPGYYSIIQQKIIEQAATMLKPGGMMIYSTCTFSPEENEGTIAHLLHTHPEFSLVKIPVYHGFDSGKPEWVDGNEELKNCIRIWPHHIEGEGHFIALLKKDEGCDSSNIRMHKATAFNETVEWNEFKQYMDLGWNKEQFDKKEEKLYYLPDQLANIKGLRILRSGLLLGEQKKNRFEPSQALACSLKLEEFKNVISLSSDDPNVIKYLKCETLELTKEYKTGWYLIGVDGYPLGFAKLNGNSFKNKYYSGWRWM